MKKVYFIIFVFVCIMNGHSQMHVSSDAFVYVNDQFVYVQKGVSLEAPSDTKRSNFYLRNNSQLLQGNDVLNGMNSGDGKLSVYQEGTVNQYQYNYWNSPVGGTEASVGNSEFSIKQLGSPTTTLETNAATILSETDYDGLTSAGQVSIAPYWIWKVSASDDYSDWVQVKDAANLTAGEGFTMKGTSGTDTTEPYVGAGKNNPGNAQRYDFRGKPNDGVIAVPVQDNKLSLTGNPYPSAIDLRLLLYRHPGADNVYGTADDGPIENPDSDGTALFWEHDKSVNSHYIEDYVGGYGVYNAITNIYTPATFYNYDNDGVKGSVASTPMNVYERRFSPIGQGFMVRGKTGVASGTIQIKNAHRVFVKEGKSNKSEFERRSFRQISGVKKFAEIPNIAGIDYTKMSNEETPNIKINVLLNEKAVKQLVLVFHEDAKEGYDFADTRDFNDSPAPYDVYFDIDGKEFINSAKKFDLSNKYPIAFKSKTDAVFKIQVAEDSKYAGVENVFLHNKVTDEYVDVNSSEYSLPIMAGGDLSNFEITFVKKTSLGLDAKVESDSKLLIYHDNSSDKLKVINKGLVPVERYGLYDVTGKLLTLSTGLKPLSEYELNTSNLSKGVYILKLRTKNNKNIVKKVVIR